MQSTKFVASAALAAVCVVLGGCGTPSIEFQAPASNTTDTVSSPVLVRAQLFGPLNPGTGFSATLDGATVSGFTLTNNNFNADALLSMGNGMHTISGSASLLNT